jgi:hypothetical protein
MNVLKLLWPLLKSALADWLTTRALVPSVEDLRKIAIKTGLDPEKIKAVLAAFTELVVSSLDKLKP